jgi:hypothetical protein
MPIALDPAALLAAALDYASRGWYVFPVWGSHNGGCACGKPNCSSPGKHPIGALLLHGVLDASCDPALITSWWKRFPTANIGLACGPSGLYVVDVDAKGVANGYATWATLKALHSIDDQTPTFLTGSGGIHMLYSVPPGDTLGNTAGKLGPGLDTRGAGGYICVPPSRHISGRLYSVDPQWNLSIPVLPLPDALRGLLTTPQAPRTYSVPPGSNGHGPPSYGAAALRAELDDLSQAVPGTRNDSLNRAAFALGQLVAGGELAQAEVEAGLLVTARGIGLDDTEAVPVIQRGLAAGSAQPRSAPAQTINTGLGGGLIGQPLNGAPLPPPATPNQAPPPPATGPYLYTAIDALAPQPPIDWVVDGLLPTASTAIVFGQPGSKKTWSCLDLAVCICQGAPWLGFATKPGSVLLIDEESGPRRLLRRMGDSIRGHQGDETLPIFATSLHGFNFWTNAPAHGAQVLLGLIQQVQARVVIIDALADVMLGGDENAVKDAQPVFHALRQVAEASGAAIVVIHHATKATGGYRGSTAIAGAVDLLLEVTSKPNEPTVTFETTKARDSEPQTFGGECHWQTNTFVMTACAGSASAASNYTKGERAILLWLAGNGDRGTSAEIEAGTGYASGTVRNAIAGLVRDGILQRIGTVTIGTTGLYKVDALALAMRPL